MPTKRQILSQIDSKELRRFIDAYGIEVEDRRLKENLVNGIARSRKARIEYILQGLSMKSLKSICNGLGVDSKGRGKAVLIQRLLASGRSRGSKRKTSSKTPIARKAKKGKKTVADFPNLVAEWHPNRNTGLIPEMFTHGSHKKVWWRCSKDPSHEWKATVAHRVNGRGCPRCPRKPKEVTYKDSLKALYPQLSTEWHTEKNGDLTPDKITPGSGKKVWWRCSKNSSHEWKAVVNGRTRGKGCPRCPRKPRKIALKDSLKAFSPSLSAEWHPTKNGDLTPDQIKPYSHKRVWWRCSLDPSHEYEAMVSSRASGMVCPYCNSLKINYPDIASEWHPTKNGKLNPDEVTPGSNRRVWWRCLKDPAHEWITTVNNRTAGTGCPYCSGKAVSDTNSLKAKHPDIALEWHPSKNGDLTPDNVTSGSRKKVWWLCSSDSLHVWTATITDRVRGRGCPYCAGKAVSDTNSLKALYPDIAAEWHPTKNGELTPDMVTPGVGKKVWWKCSEDPSHEWEAAIYSRTSGHGCPHCPRKPREVTFKKSLRFLHPVLAKEWHPTKNGELTPDKVTPGSTKKVWWLCLKESSHEWKAIVGNRAKGRGCPYCSGRAVSDTNSLKALYPDIAAEWHPTKNGELTPDMVTPGVAKKVWWRCSNNPSHEWKAIVLSRTSGTGCPACNYGWSVNAIKGFVSSLTEHLESLTASELYLLFQQNGLLDMHGIGKTFIKALSTGRFPVEEVEKFSRNEPSLVDEFIGDPTKTLEDLEYEGLLDEEKTLEDVVDATVDADVEAEQSDLPVVQTREALKTLDTPVVTSADEEAVQFLLASAKAKLWKHAYIDADEAVKQAREYQGDEYSERVRQEFLSEYEQATELELPPGYAFKVDGKKTMPNLMQRLIALKVRENKRVGNWSGTGAGKTLSAVLSSRVIDAGLTIICCPNSVVDGWCEAITDIYPDSITARKTFEPEWNGKKNSHRYLVLNYESFQQPESASRVKQFVEQQKIDFVVIDEIHYARQRHVEKMSQRKQLVMAMITMAGERNPDLHVIGMSATPVINNLHEGKSLVELVVGTRHDELKTKATVPNCMRLHQRLVTLGTRWMPNYSDLYRYEEERPEIDCSRYIHEISALGKDAPPLELEKILTRSRLPVILEHVEPKTVIYTYYVSGITDMLKDALENAGWKTGFYTGEEKSGLDAFINGDLDVLIGSSAIGTGVDGLQNVCNKMIINVLPWTNAEFEQLKGRIYRQGQVRDRVKMVIPMTYADVRGNRWSWCDTKMRRLQFKKSIADAAVDGVVPEGHLRSPAQAMQDVMGWLKRLQEGELQEIKRIPIRVPLPDTEDESVIKRRAAYGDFSQMNRRWNRTGSAKMHERLTKNPEEWQQYHTLYREARKDWKVVPFEEMIKWCSKRDDYVIGDFGCGEAKLAEVLSDKHTVYSIDHVGINDRVIECDMAKVPLDDEILDVAVFSLSLMGSNFTDYVREAYRTLRLDGHLHIIESTSRFKDLKGFVKGLRSLGFGGIDVMEIWKFTHIHARKTERVPDAGLKLTL